MADTDPENAAPGGTPPGTRGGREIFGGARLGALVAEVIGTFLFVWMGTGTVLASQALQKGPLQLTAISLAFGLALLVAVYVTANSSGAHLNPAVSIALAAARRFPWTAVPFYVVAQFVGALLAALSNWLLFGGGTPRSKLFLGAAVPGPRGASVALFAEFLLTFMLMLAIMATAVDERALGPLSAGLAIGFVVAAGIFVTLPVSGGAFNPARALGPMIVSEHFPGWWAYVVGPLAGALAGVLCWTLVLHKGRKPEVGTPW